MTGDEDRERDEENWLARLPQAERLRIALSTLMPDVADFWELTLAEEKIPCVVCGKPSEYRDVEGAARHPGMSCGSPALWRKRGQPGEPGPQ